MKKYEKIEDFDRTCPKCHEGFLQYDTEGLWYCEKCDFSEINNVIECRECFELFLGNWEEDFGEYCNIPSDSGGTCRSYAYAEWQELAAEDASIRAHIKNCRNPNCECRNY